MLNPQRHHRFQQFAIDGAPAEGKRIACKLLSDAAGAFPGRTTQQIAHQGAADPIEIDSVMLKKTSIFTRQQRINECWRHFIQRNDEPVRSGQSAINFSVNIENGIAFRHFPDLLHVEGLCPGRVEDQNAKRTAADQRKEGNLPAPSPEPARFLFAVAGRSLKNLHRKSFDNLAIDFADKTSSCVERQKSQGIQVAARAEPRYRK